MIVGPGAWSDPPRILGAVDSSTEHAVERDLNVKIVELALLAARLTQGSVQVIQAWMPFAEHLVRTWTSENDYIDYREDVRRRTSDDLAAFVASFGDRLTAAQATHVRGAPEEVIPEFIVSHGIDLTVIGTVARSGIAGLLIGNTAERILRRLPCSVLAVKPDGFVSPVRVDAPD
jgi:nucleotide-binding universal stress UspA family protein